MPRTELDKALADKLQVWLKENTPPGTYIAIDTCHGYIDLTVWCNGRTESTGYQCCLPPKHKGKCFCLYKHMEFTPNQE